MAGKAVENSRTTTQFGVKERKKRVHFSSEIRLELIKLCVENEINPYCTKVETWSEIKNSLDLKFESEFALRVLQKNVRETLQQYKQDQLKYKTGTEEEQTELKSLLETLSGQAELTATVVDLGPVSSPENNVVDVDALRDELHFTQTQSRKEKVTADSQRDELVKLGGDFAPEPTGFRRKRNSLTFDEEMIKSKQEHEMSLEKERFDFEKLQANRDFELEQKRLKLEEDKLKLNAEDCKRKDELQSNQLKLQTEMFQLMQFLVNKK